MELQLEPKVTLSTASMLACVVRGIVVKEILTGFGFSADEADRMGAAFADGLFHKVVVFGVDHYGYVKDTLTYAVRPETGKNRIELTTEQGVTYCEALDRAFYATLLYSIKVMTRKGLKPEVWYWWSSHIVNDPARLAEARTRLGLPDTSSPLPQYAPGYAGKQLVSLVPAKDRDSCVTLETARRVVTK